MSTPTATRSACFDGTNPQPLVCYVLLCYGGGFGLMPAFVSNTFGPRLMPVLYGTILTAWSCAGIVGPQIIAQLKDRAEVNLAATAFGLCLAVLALGFILSLFLPRPRSGDAGWPT